MKSLAFIVAFLALLPLVKCESNKSDLTAAKKEELHRGLERIKLLVERLREKKEQFAASKTTERPTTPIKNAFQGRKAKRRRLGKGRGKKRHMKVWWRKAFRKFWRWLQKTRRHRRRQKMNRLLHHKPVVPRDREENRKFFLNLFSRQLKQDRF